MAGMETKLHLIANEPGTFKGFSANYSGAGFTGMKFNAIATPTKADFNQWVEQVKTNANNLTHANYVELAKASENNPVAYYGKVDDGLFHTIVMKYMQAHGDMNKKHHAMGKHQQMSNEHQAMGNHSMPSSHSQGEE